MRILILGTSNSILRLGYVSGLSAQFPRAEIDNRSVGEAAGVQFACWGNIDFGAYDAVLFDSVPTDVVIVAPDPAAGPPDAVRVVVVGTRWLSSHGVCRWLINRPTGVAVPKCCGMRLDCGL